MPINDNPIANREDGSPIYDNAPTVGAVALIIDGKVLAIRRNNEPGKGKIGLPAGYHMRGETWKEGLARELFEETGCQINPAHLRQATELYTDEYGNNMVFAFFTLKFWANLRRGHPRCIMSSPRASKPQITCTRES